MYVEKPVSHNVSEGRRVVEAARKYGKICQTGTQCRSNPGMRNAIEFVHKRQARQVPGRPRPVLQAARLDRSARRLSAAFDASTTICGSARRPMAPVTRPQFHYDWHWQWAYGNGDLGNQGIHQMDIARWGLGVNELCRSVLSYGGRFGYEDAGETANTQVVRARLRR